MENPIDKKTGTADCRHGKRCVWTNVNSLIIQASSMPAQMKKEFGSFHEIGKQAAEKGEMMEVDTDSLFAGTRRGSTCRSFTTVPLWLS